MKTKNIHDMTKTELVEELREHNYDANEMENRYWLRARLREARQAKGQHYASWDRIFRATNA